MPIPEGARRALTRRLEARRQQRWPGLVELSVRFRATFAYVEATTTQDGSMSLFRLRYIGSPDQWGFAIYLASRDGYEDSVLPTGGFTGTPEQALDCACGLYLNDISAWTEAREDARRDAPKNF